MRANWRTTGNYFLDRLGARRYALAFFAIAAAVLVALSGLVYSTLQTLMGSAIADAERAHYGVPLVFEGLTAEETGAYADLVAGLVPMLVLGLGLAAASVVLVFLLFFPMSSSVSLAARQAGASRWACGVASFVSDLGLVSGVALLFQAGAIVFMAQSAYGRPAVVGANIAALVLVFAWLGLVLGMGIQRLAGVMGVGPETSRVVAMVAISAAIVVGAIDALRGVRGGASVLAGLTRLWDGPLPHDWRFALTCLGVLLVLLCCGLVVAYAEAGGGTFDVRGVLFRVPVIRSRRTRMAAREFAMWTREPSTKVSGAVSFVIIVAVTVALEAGALDPGVGLLLVVVLVGSGMETMGGGVLRHSWHYRVTGSRPASALWFRYVPVLVSQLLVIAAFMWASGILDGALIRAVEAMAIVVALGATALLAGCLVPIDSHARDGVAVTTLVALGLEMALLVTLTGVLKLTEWTLVVACLGTATLALAVSLRAIDSRGNVPG